MQFYSGATGQPGRFSEGFCLRRVQPPAAARASHDRRHSASSPQSGAGRRRRTTRPGFPHRSASRARSARSAPRTSRFAPASRSSSPAPSRKVRRVSPRRSRDRRDGACGRSPRNLCSSTGIGGLPVLIVLIFQLIWEIRRFRLVLAARRFVGGSVPANDIPSLSSRGWGRDADRGELGITASSPGRGVPCPPPTDTAPGTAPAVRAGC